MLTAFNIIGVIMEKISNVTFINIHLKHINNFEFCHSLFGLFENRRFSNFMFCRCECKGSSGYVLEKEGHSSKLDNEQEGLFHLNLGFEVSLSQNKKLQEFSSLISRCRVSRAQFFSFNFLKEAIFIT